MLERSESSIHTIYQVVFVLVEQLSRLTLGPIVVAAHTVPMKQRFMLDTNSVRMLLERRSPQLDQWFAQERCSLSAILAAEIRFGLARRRLPESRTALVCDLLEVLPVEALDEQVAKTYGAR